MRALEDAGFAVESADAGSRTSRRAGSSGSTAASSRRCSARSPRSAARGTRASAPRGGGSPRSRPRPSRGRGSCSSSATSEVGQLPRTAAAHAAAARAAALRRAGSRSACASLDSLPGFRVAPLPNAWGRTAGAPGAWREAERAARVRGRRPPAELVESLEFPEAIGNELTLRRALGALARHRARAAGAARPLRPQGRALGSSCRRRLVAAGADAARAERRRRPHPHRARAEARRSAGARARASPRARRADRGGRAAARAPRRRRRGPHAACSEGLRQVRASTGSGSVCTVVEVAPWSRIPETRALFVPRDD